MAYVSDHAVLRYLERVKGIDIEAVRRELTSPVIDTASEFGCATVLRHDCTMRLTGSVVSTIIPKRKR